MSRISFFSILLF